MFYDYFDPNVEQIISIDFSHFNSSLLESAESMFYGCTSLETINLSNFNAPLLEKMNNMFFHCNSLKSIDLSKVNSSSLTNINRLFCGCVSLEYLNLNGLHFKKVEDASHMFYNVKNLKFINIYDISYNDIFKNEIKNISVLNDNNIVICQKEKLITNQNYLYFDYNIEINEYECRDFIIVYYKQTTEYESGFLINGIDSRNNILFIINENNIYHIDDKLNINSSIKLCFKNNVTNLEKFFDASIDNNAQKIISIDLSHFDSSLVTNIDNLFSDCQELLALDISNFNSKNIKTSSAVFNNNKKLKYIKLYNITNLNNVDIKELINKNLVVCQNNMILQSENLKYICCDFNLELERCHSNNYIRAKYGSNVTFTYGFKYFTNSGKEHLGKKGVNYIIEGNSIFRGDEPLLIYENETIEIHFYPNTTSLYGFFSDGPEPLISADLSHFDSSLVTDLQGMFARTQVKEINFTNFNTSSVTSMEGMFLYCDNLESLDLSSFQTSNVSSMARMFSCENLKYLDISNFDFYYLNKIYQEANFSEIPGEVEEEFGPLMQPLPMMDMQIELLMEFIDMFSALIMRGNLKYLDLYNTKNYDFFNFLFFMGETIFILNQKEKIITPPGAILTYCDTSKSPLKCESNNYIIVKYKDNVDYTSGFINDNCDSRNGVSYLIYY